MGGEAGTSDRLLSLLREIDIGETTDSQHDRMLAFIEPVSQTEDRLTFSDRSQHALNPRQISEFHKPPLEAQTDILDGDNELYPHLELKGKG